MRLKEYDWAHKNRIDLKYFWLYACPCETTGIKDHWKDLVEFRIAVESISMIVEKRNENDRK